jgi:putative transposase
LRFSAAEQAQHPIAPLGRVLGVSRAGYDAWRTRAPSPRARATTRLACTVQQIHAKSQRTSGAPRGHAALRPDHGVRGGRKRVARLMRLAGRVGWHRRRAIRTTKRAPPVASAPDLVARALTASAPKRLGVAAITSLPIARGLVFLAVVLDVFSRNVVGGALADHLRSELVLTALEFALGRRQPAAGLVHHSDHGSQYASLAFGQRCQQAGLVPSMGAVGDCYDNALAESFFATLETELIAVSHWRTLAEARTAVFAFIETFYNPRRRHSALGYLSPTNDEKRYECRQLAS